MRISKNLIVYGFCLMCCLLTVSLASFNNCLFASDEINTKITVYGEASKKVTPNCATIYMSIENVDINAEISKNLTLTMYQQAIDKLSEIGVNKNDIKMSYFSTYPSYDYNNCKTLIGNYAVLNFSYKLNNLDKVTESIDILYNLGITSVSHINYEATEIQELYNNLLKQAILNAKQKAQNILGKTDLTIIELSEENTYCCTTLYKSYADKSIDNDLSNQIEISAKVKAVIE